MFVAKPGTLCGPASSSDAVDGATVNDGGSLIGFTVIETVAVENAADGSVARKTKLSKPLKSAAGVYVTSGGVPDNEPCDGPLSIVYTIGSFSTSVAVSVIAFAVSSSVVTD